ncbi:MAG: ornithine cyclodeaminase family protein [candidate division NC10 bacterium]|nr:ornithine cyclodeaminase family protein [candidate division NC10 bacterium]
MPFVLTARHLEVLLDMPEVITAVEQAFRELYRGSCVTPQRLALEVHDHRGMLLLMPSYLGESGALGTKIVSVYGENPKRGIPTVIATYLLCEADTGRPMAIMDGTYLTAIRTAATSAVATKYLARKDSQTLGVFGAGVQGRFHLWALLSVLPIREVRVYDPKAENVQKFAKELSERHRISIIIASRPQEVVNGSDVIVTATTSPVPVFDGRDLHPGTHINAIGAFTPETREVDSEAVLRSQVVVDSYQGAWAEAGDVLIPLKEGKITKDHIYAELAEVVAGAKEGRRSPEQITLFKSVGLAIEDTATAKLAYDKALQKGRGQVISL